MNREEIVAKIADMEKLIQNKSAVSSQDDSIENDSETEFALCLGGGGGKGAYQLGVYEALSEYGIWDRVTAIAGASIGSINSVLFAGADPEKSRKAWDDIKFETVFDVDPDLVLDGKPGFMTRREMIRLMDSYVDYDIVAHGDRRIWSVISECSPDGSRKPLYVELTDLSKSDIEKVVLASSALPVLYEPVEYKGKKYYDGGVTDNVPVKPLYDAGYRNIIICGLNPDSRKKLGEFEGLKAIEIYPSVDLGDLMTGTLDFSADSTKFRYMLGYKDAVRTLKAELLREPAYIANLDHYKAIDIADIETQMRMDRSSSAAKSSMDGINRILTGLGIEN